MKIKQGDIIIVPFPFTDNFDKGKVRPAVVLSTERVHGNSKDVILAQVSSSVSIDSFSFNLEYNYLDNSLVKSSQVRCHKIFTIHQSLIKGKASSLTSEGFELLRKKILTLI